MLEAGIKYSKTHTVTAEETASRVGSGLLEVYATPSMIALMEETCAESVQGLLEEGITSVGTELNIKHLSADPVGAVITCESELIKTDGRMMVFKVTCKDELGIVGEGEHTRFTVKAESFLEKTNNKFNR